MTQLEYEQKKRECWEEFCNDSCFCNSYGMTEEAFYSAFDRAYALGKHETKPFGISEQLNAEGEDEVLTVSRNQIGALQGEIFKAIMDAHDADDWQDAAHYILDVMPRSFAALFGSKCLPDEPTIANNATVEDPKPVEPKFKYSIGQKVKSAYADEVLTIKEHCRRVGNDNVYKVEEYTYTWNECELRPYTEPTNEGTRQEQCVPKKAESGTRSFDTILKDGFRNERRLNIAVQILSGIVASDKPYRHHVKRALELTDALIAECEKKGGSK